MRKSGTVTFEVLVKAIIYSAICIALGTFVWQFVLSPYLSTKGLS